MRFFQSYQIEIYIKNYCFVICRIHRAAGRIGAAARSGLVARYGWARLPELRQSGLLASSLAAAGRPEMRERLRELEDERGELLAGLRAGGARGERLTEVEQALRELRDALPGCSRTDLSGRPPLKGSSVKTRAPGSLLPQPGLPLRLSGEDLL